MMLRSVLVGVAIHITAPAFGQEAIPGDAAAMMQVSEPADFASLAAVSNKFELESSALAVDNTENGEVQAFAEQMIADHSKAAQDLRVAATEEGLVPPTGLDQTYQDRLDALTNAEAELFDGAYIAAQVQTHDEAVALFYGYIANGPDGALKDFAAATLPTLQVHLEHVRAMAVD